MVALKKKSIEGKEKIMTTVESDNGSFTFYHDFENFRIRRGDTGVFLDWQPSDSPNWMVSNAKFYSTFSPVNNAPHREELTIQFLREMKQHLFENYKVELPGKREFVLTQMLETIDFARSEMTKMFLFGKDA